MSGMMMKYPIDGALFLVTGGAGFIGSNLCEAILKRGGRVRCLDNMSTGKMTNVIPMMKNPAFEFVQGDIRDYDTCEEVCKSVDYILHEAALGSVPRSIEVPVLYCANNILGTVNVFEAARQNHVKRVVYATSSSVYGNSKDLPKCEGQESELLSPYALTKRCDEEWAKQYTRHYGISMVGLRYFNVFGRRQNPDGDYAAVIPKFIEMMLEGRRPVIHGDGKQTRDFTYIENVIEANLKACFAPAEADGEVFNIACGEYVCLMDVYRQIAEMLNFKDEPLFDAPRKGDIMDSHADISKANRILGYHPEYDFRRGLQECIQWYRDNL